MRSGWRGGVAVWIALGSIQGVHFVAAGVRDALEPWSRGSEPAPLRLLGLADLPYWLPRLLEGVPDDARLLVVTDSVIPPPLAPYLARFEARVLCGFSAKLLSTSHPLTAAQRFALELRFDQLEREQRRFTMERYRGELARATHLLLLNAAPREWEAGGFRLQELRSAGDPGRPAAVLYQVARDEATPR